MSCRISLHFLETLHHVQLMWVYMTLYVYIFMIRRSNCPNIMVAIRAAGAKRAKTELLFLVTRYGNGGKLKGH